MRSSRISLVPWLIGGMLGSSAMYAGCSASDDAKSEDAQNLGTLAVELQATENVALDSVDYVITGPGGFTRSGTIDIANSNTLSGRIDGIPFGAGYTIGLTAKGRGDSATCTGSSNFDVLSAGTTTVQVSLQCKLTPRQGGILVSGAINVCPSIEAINAAPAEVNVGASIQLSATGSDPDEAPQALSYAWTASSGTLSSTDTANPTFTCTSPGRATITLALSDGDTCPDQRSVSVTCSVSTQPITVSFQDGVAPTPEYRGTHDATLLEKSPTENTGAEDSCDADGDDGNGVDKTCLMRWDVSAIPAGSVVKAASLTVRVTSSTNNTYPIYALLRPWDEAQTTWVNAQTDAPWAEAGARAATDRGAVLIGSITGATGTRTIELNADGVALVQSWVDGSINAGIVFVNTDATDGIDFVSSEGTTLSQRPRLNVTYVQGDGSSGGGSGNSTDANLKVAFIGDTDHGTNLRKVLELVVAEGAQGLLVQGDMSYSDNPTSWWNAVEAVLGPDYPVFLSRGNHDDATWPDYLPKAANHLDGAERIPGAHDANYKTIWRGLSIVAIRKGDSPERIRPFFENDPHTWKICQWHQNQEAMQVGEKGDEMGWGVYEACRELGAIIQTGHEHSYERTRTLTNTQSQTVDPTCSDPSEVCVGPGRTFVNVVGLGGNSVRHQARCLPATFPYGCNQEWASIYTSNQQATYGVQFITFNVNGKPSEAEGYFKDINGNVTDTFKVHAEAFK